MLDYMGGERETQFFPLSELTTLAMRSVLESVPLTETSKRSVRRRDVAGVLVRGGETRAWRREEAGFPARGGIGRGRLRVARPQRALTGRGRMIGLNVIAEGQPLGRSPSLHKK